ncbi:hypothetical protein JHK87_010258 [Glycine soja]|nr:hypothetical protein JHK87_010258 [Glycine soja]
MLSSITSVHSLALQEKKYRPEATSASLPPLIKASSRGALQSDQKQAQQCYAESLKVVPYPLTREPTKSHLTTSGDTQVMSMDEGSPIQALIVYRATLDDIFDTNTLGGGCYSRHILLGRHDVLSDIVSTSLTLGPTNSNGNGILYNRRITRSVGRNHNNIVDDNDIKTCNNSFWQRQEDGCLVEEMRSWIDGRWHWDLRWRRRWFKWELDSFKQIEDTIHDINLTLDVQDSWR